MSEEEPLLLLPPAPLTIAIDFDNTWTADPELWNAFIENAISRGHTVVCVTARYRNEENLETVKIPGIKAVYFTGGAPKMWYMANIAGRTINVWVDDDPRAVLNGI